MDYEGEERILEWCQKLSTMPDLTQTFYNILSGYAYIDQTTLVKLSDHWAENIWTSDETRKVFSEASDFQIPQGYQWQGNFLEIQKDIQNFFRNRTNPVLQNS